MKHLLEEKKKNRTPMVWILVLLGICVFLVGAYVLLSRTIEPSPPPLPHPPGMDAEYIVVDTNNRDDIIAFFTDVGGEGLHFTRESGDWVIRGREEMTIDQTIPETMLNSIEEVQVSELLLEYAPNLSPFGFDEPTYTIRLYFGDGTNVAYLFGDFMPALQLYYFTIQDSDRLYTIAFDLAWKILEFWDVVI